MKKKNNTEQNDIENIEPYQVDKFSKVPSWIIISFAKYWAAAAAVFFIIIGGSDVGFDFSYQTDDPVSQLSTSFVIIVLIALFTALFMNYAVKQLSRMLYSRRNNCYRFLIYNGKGLSSFFIYLAYSLLMSIILFFVVSWLSYMGWVFDPFGTTGGVGIEPFTYGFAYIVVDLVFLIIKNLVQMIIQRIIYNKQMKNDKPIVVEA